MNDEELLTNQVELQKQAYDVLDKLNLLPFLSQFGKPVIVGSLALGLMTWRDIDIDLITSGNVNVKHFWHTAKYLLDCEGISLLTLVDNRNMSEKDRPKSMYIGGKYQTADLQTWKIDLRFVTKQDAFAQNDLITVQSQLTETKRKAILSIKQVIAQYPCYGTEVSSVDIYDAVLSKGITDLEGFKKYLLTSDITPQSLDSNA